MYPPARPAMPELGIPHFLVPPLANAILEAYPFSLALIPSGGVYTYPYMPSPIISISPVAQAEVNPMTIFTQALLDRISKNRKSNKERELLRLDRNVFNLLLRVACINKNGTSFMYLPLHISCCNPHFYR